MQATKITLKPKKFNTLFFFWEEFSLFHFPFNSG